MSTEDIPHAAMDRWVGRAPKASDITDAELLAAVRQVRIADINWSMLHDIRDALPQYPPKVVLAKLRSAVKRKLLKGCCCGCRGDFEEP